MKRFFKLTALVLAVVMITVTLSSCRYLDEKKENRAVYTDDSYNEISYHGDLYRGIDPGKYSFLTEDSYIINVTDKDLPVLLSDTYGDSANMSGDDIIMHVYWFCRDDDGNREHDAANDYFIREDKYDEISDSIKNAKLDHYYIEYEYYFDTIIDVDPDLTGRQSWEYRKALISDEATEVVTKAMEAPLSDRIKYSEIGDDKSESYIIELHRCDKDMLLQDDDTYNNGFFLVKCNDKYYFWNGNRYDEYSVYPIKEKDYDCIEKVFRDYSTAITYGSIMDDYEYEEEPAEAEPTENDPVKVAI